MGRQTAQPAKQIGTTETTAQVHQQLSMQTLLSAFEVLTGAWSITGMVGTPPSSSTDTGSKNPSSLAWYFDRSMKNSNQNSRDRWCGTYLCYRLPISILILVLLVQSLA